MIGTRMVLAVLACQALPKAGGKSLKPLRQDYCNLLPLIGPTNHNQNHMRSKNRRIQSA